MKGTHTPKNNNAIGLTLWCIIGTFFFLNSLQSQEELEDIFTLHPNKKAVARDSTLYPSRLIIAPVVAYTPETSFGFGVGAKFLFKFKGSASFIEIYAQKSIYFLFRLYHICKSRTVGAFWRCKISKLS